MLRPKSRAQGWRVKGGIWGGRGGGGQDNRIQVTVQHWVAFPGVGRGSNWSSYETVYEIIE